MEQDPDGLSKIYELIETWDATNIALALTLVKERPLWRQALEARYGPILRLVGRKSLRSLDKLPHLLQQNRHYHQMVLDLGTAAEAVLGSIPLSRLHCRQRTDVPIGEWVTALTQVRFLYIHETRLRALPQSLGRLARLESMHLIENRIRSLPESLGELTQLKALYVAQHRLPELPNSIGQLAALESLELVQRGEYPVNLPETLTQCTQLKKIRVTKATNATLPTCIYALPQLEELTWQGTQLQLVEPSIANCTQLRQLDLSRNPQLELPEVIANLSQLERLNLTGTPYFIGQKSGLLVGSVEIKEFFRKNIGI